MTREEFFYLPILSSYFPLVYGNNARWESMTSECGDCSRILEGEFLRGTVVSPALSYRDCLPKTFVVAGVGLCDTCNRLTYIDYQLHDDMSMVGLRDGQWAVWKARPSRWSKIKKFFRKWNSK